MALNAAIMFAVVKGIELAAKAIDNYVHSNEIAISKASELKSAFESSISTINEHQSTLDSLSSRFTELSNGVDDYGNNVSLTKEQMKEYSGLVKDLIAINPALVKGYDAENQAIIDKNTALEDTVALLERERELELEKATSTSNLKTIGEGAVAKRNELLGSDFTGQFSSYDLDTVSGQAVRFGTEAAKVFDDESIKAFYDYTNSKPSEKMYGKSDWLKTFGFDVSDENVDLDIEGYLQRNIDTFSKNMDEILIKANIDPSSDQAKNLKLYVQEWQTLNSELETIDSSYIDEHLQKIPQLVSGYDALTNSQKSFINEYIRNGFSAYDLENDAVKVKSSITGMVESISDDPKIKNKINDLFALNAKDLNVTDYADQYNQILDGIISDLNLSDSDANKLRVNLTIDADHLQEKFDNAIASAKEKFDGNDLTQFFADNSINTSEEIDAWLEIAQAANSATEAEKLYLEELEKGKEKAKSFVSEFSNLPVDKIEKYISLLNSGDMTEGNISSFTELKDLMSQTGMSAEGAAKALKDYADGYTLSTDLISNMQGAYNLLKNVGEQYKKTGLIGLSSLESIVKQYPQLRTAVNEYVNGLISAEDMMAQLQTAYDNDAIAFRSAMAYKLSGNEDFFTTIVNNNQSLFDDLSKAYGLDVENWKTMAQAKAEIDQKLIQSLSSAWSKYYNIVFDSVTGLASLDGMDLSRAGSHGVTVSQEQQEAWSAATKQANKYNQIINKLNEAASIQVETPDFGGIGSVGSKSGSKKDKKDFSEVFDWVETTIKRVDEKIQDIQNKISDTSNWKPKNTLTDTAIDEMANRLTALQSQFDTYQKKADSYNLSPTYIDKIKNGTLEIETVTDEVIANNIKGYQEWYNKAEDVRKKIDETKKTLKELAQTKLDNIINDFDSLVSLMNKYTTYSNNLLSLQKELGESITKADYKQLINQQEAIYKQLQSKYNSLSNELSKAVSKGTIKVGSEEWRKYNEELIAVNSSMNDAVSSMNDFRKALINLPFEELERITSALDRINNGISTMSDLIGDDGLLDGGMLTSKGLAKIALLGQQYANAKQQAADYEEAINAINEMYENGSLTQAEYNEKLNEYTNAQLSAVKATKEAEQAILQFRYNAIQAQIDDMNNLIAAKKKALQTEKEYQDYLESISEKQTDINNLQAKIDELSLSTDRKDIAQRLQLEQQLSDAKKNLSKTQADYAYDKTLESLDKQAEDYQDAKKKELEELKSNTDAQKKVIEEYLGQVKDNYKTVYNTLTKYGTDYNVTMTSELTSPWESANSAVSTFKDAVSDAISQINIDIANIDLSRLTELVSTMQGFSANGNGSASFEDITGSGTWQKNSKGWWYGASNDDYASDGIYTIGGKQYNFNEDGYMKTGWDDSNGDWRYFEPENGQMVKSAWRKSKDGKDYYLKSDGTMATDMAIKAKDGNGYYYVDDSGVWDGKTIPYDDVKKRNITVGYKSGTTNSKPGLKYVNEDGPELIVARNGTVLNSVGGDTIFTKNMTDKLWDFAIDPSKFVLANMPKYDYRAMAMANRNNVSMNIDSPLLVVQGNADKEVLTQMNERLDTFIKKEIPQKMMEMSKQH